MEIRDMKSHPRLLGTLAVVFFYLAVCPHAIAQVNVTTYHNDRARTGQNTQETILTISNVRAFQFGKLFSVAVDGPVYAQPLVLTNVTIGGGTHNVAYIATENDSVYAIDADKGTVYWKKSLILNGGKPIPDGFNSLWDNNISPQYGITGTPVIDPTTNTIYVVASTDESGVAYHRLHALDVTSASEKFGGPKVISGSYGGTTFSASEEFNRPALLLQNGHLIVAFGQPCEACTFGWVFSYSASTLALEATFCTNPGTPSGSIWMSGDGVAADSSGNLYFATGDGSFDGSDEFGDSIIKLGLPSGGVLDYFTPNTQSEDSSNDWDQGSGGVLVLPDLTSGAHPHLLVQAGKTGTIYLIDRTNMGKYCGSSSCKDNDVQEILGRPVGGLSTNLAGVWGSPAYWNGNVYFPSANKESGLGGNVADSLKAYSFNAGGSGILSTQPTSYTLKQFSWPGPNPTISSNGTSSGIVWALDNSSSCCQVLHAYDATALDFELYTSNQNPCGANDTLNGAVKFSVPTVANGKVYVGGNGEVSVFGLPTSKSFCLFVTPPSQTINPGQETSYAINVTASGGFTGTVSLSDNCSQWGFTCYMEPSSISGSGDAMLMLIAPGVGNYPETLPINITATSGSISRMVQVSITVQ
jgi:PQQ-like domain